MIVWRRTPGLLAATLLIVAIFASGTVGIAAATQTADGTATFHGNAARTGEQPGPTPQGNPTIAWQFQTGDAVRSSPVIANGILYIGSNDGFLYALEAVTGAEQWRFETGGRITGAAAVAGDSLYVGSADGFVYAIDATSGEQRWRFFAAELNVDASRLGQADRQRGMITSSVAVVDDLVFVTSNSFKVTALDAATGIERWHTIATGSDVTTPTVADGRVFFASQRDIAAMDASTGEPLWRAEFVSEESAAEQDDESDPSADQEGEAETDAQPTAESDQPEATEESTTSEEGDNAAAPSLPEDPLANGELPLAQFIEMVYPDLQTWDISAAPVVAGDALYVVVFGTTAEEITATAGESQEEEREIITSNLLSLNPETGNVTGVKYFYAWEPIVATPAVVDGTAYVGVDQGLLYAFDVEAGRERWGVQTEAAISSSPVVAADTVFFGNDDGYVFALATDSGETRWRFETGGAVRTSPVVQGGLVYVGSDDGSVYAIGGS